MRKTYQRRNIGIRLMVRTEKGRKKLKGTKKSPVRENTGTQNKIRLEPNSGGDKRISTKTAQLRNFAGCGAPIPDQRLSSDSKGERSLTVRILYGIRNGPRNEGGEEGNYLWAIKEHNR